MTKEDRLVIGGKSLKSRLFIGTGKLPNKLLPGVIAASGTEVVTVALRRVDFRSPQENPVAYIPENVIIMPNTSGARNAEEAVKIARLAQAAGCGNWVKIEVITDQKYLLPDNEETVKATEILAKEGFVVLPYIMPDLIIARRLEEVGAAAVMPLGAPIGSNRGLRSREFLRILVEEITTIPVIVDAGIGKPSEAAAAMEMGVDAVLVNTAVATAGDPVLMAGAFAAAVKAGREGYLAGLGPSSLYASASSPLTGFLHEVSK
ncbi:MAG: thiazole synthase [Firmicutes bacterium]|nr:thiazole synthase [Bacillota bacterium]